MRPLGQDSFIDNFEAHYLEPGASEVRGLPVAEERSDAWEEDHPTGQIVAQAGPPTSLALLPTMRSPLRYR